MRPAPQLPRKLLSQPIAHRGLHGVQQLRIENSRPAFEAAIAADLAIECDLRAGARAQPLVFHDATTGRLLNEDRLVSSLSSQCLQSLRYADGKSTISTFCELLSLVAGRVAVFAEIKSDAAAPATDDFLCQIADTANAYPGPLALMSFDPGVIHQVAALAPTVPRGLVLAPAGMAEADGTPAASGAKHQRAETPRAVVAQLSQLNATRLSFLAPNIADLAQPWVQDLRRTQAVALVSWTVRTPDQWRRAVDFGATPIFEGIEHQALPAPPTDRAASAVRAFQA